MTGLVALRSSFLGSAGGSIGPPSNAYVAEDGTTQYVAEDGVTPYIISVPTIAGLAGYTNRTFVENFSSLSTIDTGNTKAAGFKWYTNNAFPNLNAFGTIWTAQQTATPTPSGRLSVTGGGELEISTSTLANFGQALNTCVWNGSAVIGNKFAGGFYVRANLRYDPSTMLASMNANYTVPALFFYPTEFLDGTVTTGTWPELDLYIASASDGSAVATAQTQVWKLSVPSGSPNTGTRDFQQILTESVTVDANQHTIAMLWVPQNGATPGRVQFYYDGVEQPVNNQSYSASASPVPAYSPNNFTGSFSQIDSMHMCMMLQAGANTPTFFSDIEVWQGSGPPSSGASITSPTASTLTDYNGNVWSFTTLDAGSGLYHIFENGVDTLGKGTIMKLYLGDVWMFATGFGWFVWSGSAGFLAQSGGPP